MTRPPNDLVLLAEAVIAAAQSEAFLPALRDLHRLRAVLDELEPDLIAAARLAGASWQALAPVLGVASRQAAERRYLRLVPARPEQEGSTRDQRVRQVRDTRARTRAVNDWANDHTAALRRLAAAIITLDGLDPRSADDIARLDRALADADASALPSLLAGTRRHLADHPILAGQVDAVTADAARVGREIQERRDGRAAAGASPPPDTAMRRIGRRK